MYILCIDYSLFEIKQFLYFMSPLIKSLILLMLIIAKEKVQSHMHFEKVVLNINLRIRFYLLYQLLKLLQLCYLIFIKFICTFLDTT